MAKRFLLSTVPDNFKIEKWNDELGFAYQVHVLSERMTAEGVIPYSALDLFRYVNGAALARTTKRKGYLILGEVVSARLYNQWKEAIRYTKLSAVLQLVIDGVAKQDRERGLSRSTAYDRAAQLLPEIIRDIEYWRLCNNGRSVSKYKPELKFRPDPGGYYDSERLYGGTEQQVHH